MKKSTTEGGEGHLMAECPDHNCTTKTEHVTQSRERTVEGLKAPDGGWGWWVVVGSTFGQLIIGGIERSRGVLFPELKDRFGASAATTAWVISLTAVFRLCGGPFSSALSNKFGVRPVVLAGAIITAASFVISAFASNIGFLFFSFGVIGGIGRMCAYAPCVIIVGLYFDKRRALGAGLSSAGIGAGTFILPPLVQFLLQTYGYVGAFLVMAAIYLNVCVAASLFRPLKLHWKIKEIDRKRKAIREEETASHWDNDDLLLNEKLKESALEENEPLEIDSNQEDQTLSKKNGPIENILVEESHNDEVELDKTKHKRSVLDRLLCRSNNRGKNANEKSTETKKKMFEFGLLKDLPFLCFCITLCLFTMSFQMGQVFIVDMAQERGVSKANSALCLSIMGVLDTAGRITSGILFDRPRIKPYRTYTYNLFLFFIAVTCFIFPIMAHNFLSFGILSGFFGLFTGTYIAQKSVIIVDLLGVDKLISSFGMMICFQGIGSLIGPILSGVLRDHFGRYDESFYFGGAVSFASGLVFLVGNIYSYRRTKGEQRNKQPVDEAPLALAAV